MFIKNFTNYVLRGRKQAVILSLIFTILPLLGWVSSLIIALVTLRKGTKEGLIVLTWTVLPYVVLVFQGYWLAFINGVFFGGALIWILAVILRRYSSWAFVLEIAALLGAIVIACMHLFIPNLQVWWANYLTGNFSMLMNMLGGLALNADLLKQAVNVLAQYATGIQAVVVLFGIFTILLMARGMQSLLFNPGGLGRELMKLRLDMVMVIALVMCLLLAWLGPVMFKDIAPVIILPFILAGISLVHGCLSLRKLAVSWLVLFYVVLVAVVIVFPWSIIFLMLLAIADSFIDFRGRLQVA